MNFNQSKKNKDTNKIEADEFEDFEDDEIEETENDEEDDFSEEEVDSKKKKSKSSENDFSKFIIKLVIIVVAGILLLFLVLSIASMFTKGSYSYEKIEEIMTNAAISYFKDYPESLPKTELQIVEIETPTLTQAGKMKDLSEYTKDNVTCTGKVSVSKAGDEYVYTPSLNCGEAYSSKSLATAITENSNVVTSGYGLYNINNNLVFRGETVNNYVKIGENLWRIVKIDSNKNVYLIKEKYAGYSTAWDDRYNSEYKYNIGINNYSASRIKEYLESLYKETKEDLMIFNDVEKTKLSNFDICIGKRSLNSTTNTNVLECQSTVKSQRIGLLTVSDYINASIDANCKSPEDESCQNYNYLVSGYRWWTTTAVSDTSSNVFSITDKGLIKVSKCSDYNYVRPVVKISSRVMIATGTGTENDPYIIK